MNDITQGVRGWGELLQSARARPGAGQCGIGEALSQHQQRHGPGARPPGIIRFPPRQPERPAQGARDPRARAVELALHRQEWGDN
eukprot:9301095-Lingulodinium_polyedra.AAC.1